MRLEPILRFLSDPQSADLDALLADAAVAPAAAPDPDLYRAAVAAVLASHGITARDRRPVLALAAEGESRLADEIFAGLGDEAALRPMQPRGVDPMAARSWLAARQRDRRPALLVGGLERVEQLLAQVERRGLRFRLAAGSDAIVLRQPRTVPDEGIRPRLVEHFGLEAGRLRLAWEPAASTTPFLAAWDGRNLFTVPHWVRIEAGDDGRLALTDLANLGGPLAVETRARATVDGPRFALE